MSTKQKQEWPELVGMDVDQACAIIRRERPDLTEFDLVRKDTSAYRLLTEFDLVRKDTYAYRLLTEFDLVRKDTSAYRLLMFMFKRVTIIYDNDRRVCVIPKIG